MNDLIEYINRNKIKDLPELLNHINRDYSRLLNENYEQTVKYPRRREKLLRILT
jgi:hypothetical protein